MKQLQRGLPQMNLAEKIRSHTLRLLERRGPRIGQIAVSQEVLCPAESTERPGAIFDESDFDRVIAYEKQTSAANERSRMRAGVRHDGATTLYRLENATLWDGWLSSKGWRAWNCIRPLPWPGGPPVEIEQAAIASTFVGSIYFAHWLTDDLPLHLEAEKHAPAVVAERMPWMQQPPYMELLGLSARPLIRARFRSLIYIDALAQNSFRAAKYHELRRRIRQATQPVAGRKVMLHRGSGGIPRLLMNERAIEEELARRGWEIIDPLELTVPQVAQACSGARVVLGVEGSQLIHGFLGLVDGGAVVTIVPPYRYINHYKDLTDCAGMRYGSITGVAVEGGFEIDQNALLRLLDRVDAELDNG